MFTDFETLARDTAIPEGGVSLILLADATPRLLVPADRADVIPGKNLTLDATIEPATSHIVDRERPRDLLLRKDLINTSMQFSLQAGQQCLHLRLCGEVTTKAGALSAGETLSIEVHRGLRLDDSVTRAFAQAALRHGRVEVLFMTSAREPRLKGRGEAAVTGKAIATLRTLVPRAWWRKLLGA